MAITITAGTTVFGTANLTPTIPAGAVAGDLMICLYGTKPYNDSPTINNGWTDPGSPATNGTVAAGNGVGSMQARYFWKRHTGTESNPTITNATNNVSGAGIYLIKPSAGYTLDDPVGSGGGDNTHNTSFSITAGVGIGIASGDKCIVLATITTDAFGPSTGAALSASGATISYTGNFVDDFTSLGGDMSFWTEHFTCTAGSSSAAPTYSVSLEDQSTGSGYIVRLRESLPKSAPAIRPMRRTLHLLRR